MHKIMYIYSEESSFLKKRDRIIIDLQRYKLYIF